MVLVDKQKMTVVFFGIILLFTLFSNLVSAHRSGCHAWHSCPSDSGSYTCGDTGHCSQCPDNTYCLNGKLVKNIIISPNQTPLSNTSVSIPATENTSASPIITVNQTSLSNASASASIVANGSTFQTNTTNVAIQANRTQNAIASQRQIEDLKNELQQVKQEQQKQASLIEQIINFLKSVFPFWK
ncbi:MAG: hypothetical protein V1644_00665 [Candidatus Micrarchaeota archaeon]